MLACIFKYVPHRTALARMCIESILRYINNVLVVHFSLCALLTTPSLRNELYTREFDMHALCAKFMWVYMPKHVQPSHKLLLRISACEYRFDKNKWVFGNSSIQTQIFGRSVNIFKSLGVFESNPHECNQTLYTTCTIWIHTEEVTEVQLYINTAAVYLVNYSFALFNW